MDRSGTDGKRFINLIFSATGVSLGLAWDRDYPPTLSLSMGEGYQEDYYIVPWVRIQTYFMGMILGFILYKMRNNKKLKLNSIAATWCWVSLDKTRPGVDKVKPKAWFKYSL